MGLSLDDYNESVHFIYRNTFFPAMMCAVLSLLVSLLNAKKLIKPILLLQRIVKNIKDELGSFVRSVNIMAEALQDIRDTLELGVQNRTPELETQVTAKEKALTEPAEAQSSLMKE